MTNIETQPVHKPKNDDSMLLDILASLLDRWIIILSSMIIFIAIGVAINFTRGHVFSYTTAIIIGTKADGTSVAQVEKPDAVVDRINNIFIPQVENVITSDPKTEMPSTTGFQQNDQVFLRTVAAIEEDKFVEDFHSKIVDRLKKDYVEVLQKRLIELEKRRLNLQERLAQVAQEREQLVKEQLALNSQLDTNSQESQPQENQTGELSAHPESKILPTFFSNEVFRQRFTALSDREERLDEQLRDVTRESASFRETYAADIAVRSSEPVGLGPALTLAVAPVTGMVVGIAIALLVNIFEVLQRRRRSPSAAA